MSEVKLNLIDALQVLHGTIHGSVADACVAALSAEPETIAELASSLTRYIKLLDDPGPFATFHSSVVSANNTLLDIQPWDAGIVVIDLAARIVASESTYSMPGPSGEVYYHDGTASTDITVLYRLPHDWLFVNSVEAYQWSRERRMMKRAAQPAWDARAVLYGRPLLEFIAEAMADWTASTPWSAPTLPPQRDCRDGDAGSRRFGLDELNAPRLNGQLDDDAADDALAKEISAIHARWLMTPREDLRGHSPRDVMLVSQDFIDFDLHTRALQWSLQDEGPPCLPQDSFAYRFAGFGTHAWVIYYDLVRHLLWTALENVRQSLSISGFPSPNGRGVRGEGLTRTSPHPNPPPAGRERESTYSEFPLVCRDGRAADDVQSVEHAEDFTSIDSPLGRIDSQIAILEEIKSSWLEQPQPDYDGRIPAILLDNERKRLPIALRPRDMIIDEDCPVCQMFGDETTPLGMGVGFWHLDGCNMDDDFAFSSYRTREEWEAENLRREEFDREFNRKWEERKQRLARGEQPEPDPYFDLDPFPFDGIESTLLDGQSKHEDDEDLPQ